MAIGFNTPSKREAEQGQDNSPQMSVGMDTDKLKAETIGRLSQLGDMIVGESFNQYSPEQKAKILMDFTYYSKVADTL